MDRSSKQNINKDIVALNNALDEMYFTDIYKAFHPKEDTEERKSRRHKQMEKYAIGTLIGIALNL